ncbi:DUF4493 domain-containing protein [uncultured Phocaeicola sp.]|uniref:DUF4493 domain-containing protein n=1 Tax=uncultured Phocaeicola sp. TaxID=990718 RepID=UPI0025DAC96D|nr:DUF4493 domain-containing protein [uncultured Phocaeicola sp.]
MKKYKSLIWLLGLIIGLSSCEMRDELLGKGEAGENAGTLELGLSSVYNGVTVSRASTTVDGGTTTGNFDEKDINVDNYTLVVTNTETQEEVAKGKVSELKNESGKVVLPLSEGDYSVTAYNYEGENVTVSERPYFKGEQTFSVKKGIATSVDLTCKLACIEISLGTTTAFDEAFKDDYVVIIDNGDGASQTFDKTSIGKKYYFQTPEHQSTLNASIKATSEEGNFVELKATIQKPADAEGGVSDLEGGDSFNIQLTEEGSTDSYISIGITVDLTFTEVGETIEIPVGNIIYEGPETPGEGGEGGEEPETGTLSVTGVPATYNLTTTGTVPTIKVDMASENGIKSLVVSIESDNQDFPGLLSTMDLLEPFDLCNLEDRAATKSNLLMLGLISEDVYSQLHAGTLTSYTFEVTSLVSLLPQTGLTGSHKFTLTISDGNETKEGTLTVNVTE